MSSISLKRLAYYSAQVLTANVLGGLLIFLQPILILNLSQEYALGIFSLLVSWANIGMLLASFGLLTALQRLGSRYSARASGLEFKAYSYLRRVSRHNLVLAASGLVLVAVVVHRNEVPYILFPAIAMVLASIFYTRWYLILARIREDNFWPNIFDQSFREGVFILIALAALLLPGRYLADGFTTQWHGQALILAYTIAAVCSAWISKTYAHAKNLVPSTSGHSQHPANSSPGKKSLHRLHRTWSGIAITSFPSEVGIYLLKRIDVIVVGILISTESAGLYFLMSRIAELPNLLAGAINVIVGPEFAKMRANGHRDRIRMLYLAAAALPCLATVIMVAAVWFASTANLTDWIFGRQLDLTVLYLFLSGYTLYFALGPSSIYLTMTGGQKISSYVTCWVVGFHLVTVTFLTLWLAETGAALAFCISISLQRIAELLIMARSKSRRSKRAHR